MKYRVVFRERSDQSGENADNPADFLDFQLDDDTVLDATPIGRNEPDSLHSSDALEEDDDFLSIGTEIWEYDIPDNKQKDFEAALAKSGTVIEFEVIESSDELGVS